MELQTIQSKIYFIDGQRVMLDFDLATLYEVENRVLKQAVRRNLKRFPIDFMFQLSKAAWKELVTICDNLPAGVKYSPATPYAFTEQGVAMLSSVLKSNTAVAVNISIIRAFVLLRQHLTDYDHLKITIDRLELEMNTKFKDINEALHYLLKKDNVEGEQQNRKRIGYK